MSAPHSASPQTMASAPSGKCLLCGYQVHNDIAGEEEAQAKKLRCCSWPQCQEEAKGLHPREVSALIKLDQIKPYFSIWNKGRREDSSSSQTAPEPQPARVFPALPLYIGDMDDASDVEHLIELGVGCVVNLCAERQNHVGYEHVSGNLAKAGIDQHILVADDKHSFDITSVAEKVYGVIDAALKNKKGKKNSVLIHCWGGVNRSAAVLISYLTMRCGVPLFAAVDRVMRKRGTVLTNQSFRRQLVRLCFKNDLKLEDECVPEALMIMSASESASCSGTAIPNKPVVTVDAEIPIQSDMTCNDPEHRHKQSAPRDTPFYGLLYAAKNGCLICVRHYIEEEGVEYDSRSETRGYSAEDMARWELDKSYGNQGKKRRCEAVLKYLATCPKLSS